MKLRGLIGGHTVVVMIYLDATHNFFSIKTVALAELIILELGGSDVALENKEAIWGEGVCWDIRLQLDGSVEVVKDFLPL